MRNLSSFDDIFPSSWIGDSPTRLDVLWDETGKVSQIKEGESFSRETSVSLPSVVFDASFRYSRELLGSKSMGNASRIVFALSCFWSYLSEGRVGPGLIIASQVTTIFQVINRLLELPSSRSVAWVLVDGGVLVKPYDASFA